MATRQNFIDEAVKKKRPVFVWFNKHAHARVDAPEEGRACVKHRHRHL